MKLDGLSGKAPFTSSLPTTTISTKTGTGKFEEIVQNTQTKEVESKLKTMIKTIDNLKENLEFDMSVDNLNQYKQALRSFVDYYTKNELQVQEALMTDRRGYTKKMKIVETINKSLEGLTTNMLETHLGHLQMLKEIGEIQGLVLNLYL